MDGGRKMKTKSKSHTLTLFDSPCRALSKAVSTKFSSPIFSLQHSPRVCRIRTLRALGQHSPLFPILFSISSCPRPIPSPRQQKAFHHGRGIIHPSLGPPQHSGVRTEGVHSSCGRGGSCQCKPLSPLAGLCPSCLWPRRACRRPLGRFIDMITEPPSASRSRQHVELKPQPERQQQDCRTDKEREKGKGKKRKLERERGRWRERERGRERQRKGKRESGRGRDR
jgi:hypothetical protein